MDPATESLLREFTKIDDRIWMFHYEMMREAERVLLWFLGNES